MEEHTEEELTRPSGRTVVETGADPTPSAGWRDAGVRGRPTHRDEREGAARVDRDVNRNIELGAAAVAVEEASRATAGKRSRRPGGDFDPADTVVVSVLRCIMGGHTEEVQLN